MHTRHGIKKWCSECQHEAAKQKSRDYYYEAQWYVPVPKTPRSCIMCGKEFKHSYPNAGCCSAECQRQARKDQKRRRKARIRNTQTEPISDYYVFERDEWVCWLCEKPVDRNEVVPHPQSPTVDHVIPLAKGGTHTYDNVRCAHFMCNCLKSDSVITLF